MRALYIYILVFILVAAALNPLTVAAQQSEWRWVIYGVARNGGDLPLNITLYFASGCTMNIVVLRTDNTTGVERFVKEVKLSDYPLITMPGIYVDKASGFCTVKYKTVEYPVIYAFNTYTYIALLLSEKPYAYSVNPMCIVRYRADPLAVVSNAIVSANPPKSLRFVESSYSDFYNMIKEEKEALEEISGGGGVNWLTNIGSWLNAVLSTIPQTLNMVADGVRVFARSVASIGEAFKTLFLFIGKPGDISATYYANIYRTQLQLILPSLPQPIKQSVEDVLTCRKPLAEVQGLLKSYRAEDLNKTICDVEDSAPRGIIGFLSVAFQILAKAKDVVAVVVKHFIEINAIIIVSILAYKTARAIQLKDPSEFVEGIKWVYAIFKFYWSIIAFVVHLIIKAVQTVAQSITAASAIGSVVKSIVEKIVSAVKWIATALLTLI